MRLHGCFVAAEPAALNAGVKNLNDADANKGEGHVVRKTVPFFRASIVAAASKTAPFIAV